MCVCAFMGFEVYTYYTVYILRIVYIYIYIYIYVCVCICTCVCVCGVYRI